MFAFESLSDDADLESLESQPAKGLHFSSPWKRFLLDSEGEDSPLSLPRGDPKDLRFPCLMLSVIELRYKVDAKRRSSQMSFVCGRSW